jgi:hypothetical protein
VDDDAPYYRDAAGRVRVDQTVWGPQAHDRKVRIMVQSELESGTVYVADPSAKTARRIPRGLGDMEVGGDHRFTVRTSVNSLLTASTAHGLVEDVVVQPNEALTGSVRRALQGYSVVGIDGSMRFHFPGGP